MDLVTISSGSAGWASGWCGGSGSTIARSGSGSGGRGGGTPISRSAGPGGGGGNASSSTSKGGSGGGGRKVSPSTAAGDAGAITSMTGGPASTTPGARADSDHTVSPGGSG